MADALSLPVATKPESQDICFVAGERYSDFVERELIQMELELEQRDRPLRDDRGLAPEPRRTRAGSST